MTDRRFTVLAVTSALVLTLCWGLFAYVTSAAGFDPVALVIFSLVTLVMVGGDVGVWFVLFRRREPRALGV